MNINEEIWFKGLTGGGWRRCGFLLEDSVVPNQKCLRGSETEIVEDHMLNYNL